MESYAPVKQTAEELRLGFGDLVTPNVARLLLMGDAPADRESTFACANVLTPKSVTA